MYEFQHKIDSILKPFAAAVLKVIKRGVLHWTAGLWFQKEWTKPDGSPHKPYHFVITYNKGKAKAEQVLSIGVIGEHIWHRNTGSIGYSFAGMGKDKNGKLHVIQPQQVEVMAKLVAEHSILFGWNLDKSSQDVQPHYYWATIDGYGPGSGSPDTRIDCMGYDDAVRAKAKWYRDAIIRGETKAAKGEALDPAHDHLFEHSIGMF